MAIDVASWLQQLGLAQYEPAFRDNAVDGDVLPDLTADDLIAIGVTAVGHRRKLLSAIAALGGAAPAPAPTATPASVPAPAPAPAQAERRQLTVMFCDLVGSTALSTGMDPEDLRDVIASFQSRCSVAIRRYDGFVAKYMGDGILVYFGYPRAHEDEAERSVRAGLDIVDAMAELNAAVPRPPGVELAVRIGIASGPVIVGDQIGEGTASETAVVGETSNLAARLQALAQPNQIVVSAATRAMLGDHFDLEDLGAYELKGFAEPVPAWRVLSARDVESRFAATRTGSSAPLVGRQEEMGLLLRAWDGSSHGRGQVVLIQGEAGVGKSRLVEGLREAAGKDHIWVAIRCSPFHTASAFHPIIEHLKRVFGWQPEDTAPQHLAKLEDGLADFKTLPLSESVRLFADLMAVPLPEDRYPRLSMTAQQQRDATLDAIIAWLIETAEGTPVLMAWEDLHWADPTTLETLGMLIEQAPTAAMLVVATYRPELTPPWPQRSHMTPITLNRLERPEVETMVGHLAGGRPLPGEVIDPGCGLPIAAEAHPPAISPAGGEAAGGPVSRGGGHPTGIGRPSLHRSELSGAGDLILAQSRRRRGKQVGEAIDQFRRGLALVEALSDMRERAERELDLQNGAWSRPVRDKERQPARLRPNLCAGVGALSATRGSLPGVHGAPRPVSPPSGPPRDGEVSAFCRGGVARSRRA
jgi:class 3 adenylate cyclase